MPGGSTERRSFTTSAIPDHFIFISVLGRGVCLCAKLDVSVEWYCLARASIQDFCCRVEQKLLSLAGQVSLAVGISGALGPLCVH